MSHRTPARHATIAALAALAAGALVLGTAAPAMAAGRTLPTGDRLFAVECDDDYLLEPQLFSVDAATAAVTKVGEGTYPTAGEFCAYQSAYNAKTGKSYFVDLLDLDGTLTVLSTIDTTTGQSSIIGEFTVPADEFADPFIASIAIGPDGSAYAIDSDDYLYTLNLDNAQLVEVAQINAVGEFRSFGSDPRTGVFYIANDEELHTLNVANATATPVYDFVLEGIQNVTSLQVDSAGVIWLINATEESSELWSTTGSAATELFSGDVLEGDPFISTQSLLLIPAALAATGSEFAPVGLIAGLGVLTLGGALLLMRQSVLRRRATA